MSLYFNNAFSKRPLKEAIQSMLPFVSQYYENPLTESEGGERARNVIEIARGRVASLLNAKPEEIFFVSSGTEANNWALKGLHYAWLGKKDHVVISAVEHFSVYQTAQFLDRYGTKVTIVPVDGEGNVDVSEVSKAIKPSTFLVSIQCASDEIGVIQNHKAISQLKADFPDVIFHTDAIQFICYEDLDLQLEPFDLVSISSNAIYGPPGAAALFVRAGTRLVPFVHGGMQESGMRAGLQSVASIVGFGKSAEINQSRKAEWKKNLAEIQKQTFIKLDQLDIPVTGSRLNRVVDNIHMVVDVDGEALLALLLEDGISASTGSTCYQYAQKESHVLKAMGFKPEVARGAVLFTLSFDHSKKDLEIALESLGKDLNHLRGLKP